MDYVIGLDCGGTKTEGQVYDLKGNLLKTEVSGYGNLLVDYTVALENIKSVLASLLETYGEERCQSVVFGIAGIDSGGLRAKLMEEFSAYKLPLVFLNDGELAHYSVLKGEDGLVVTAGTGSVFLGRVEEKWYRVGGWGQMLGDEGSAFHIAQKGLKILLEEYDQGKPLSQFSKEILKHFAVEDTFALVKKVYQLEKGKIASLAGVIAKLVVSEPLALEILVKAGRDLASQSITLAEKMPLEDKKIKIGLNGSVIEKNEEVRQVFFAELRAWAGNRSLEIMDKQSSCAKGAYYYYLKHQVL